MLKGQQSCIQLVKVNSDIEEQYIIKDNTGITIGRIFIIENLKESKSCTLRIKFYQYGEKSYKNLKETLRVLSTILLKGSNINKINIIISEDVDYSAFLHLGFELEGIITNNILTSDGDYKNELLFGIDFEVYERISKEKLLSLEGRRIELRLLTPENSQELLNYYIKNKDHLSPFEPLRDESFYTLDCQKRILSESYKQFLNGVSTNLGIYKDNTLIGKVQLSNMVMGIFKNTFVGYSIDKDEQGKGYMTETLNLVIRYAFDELRMHRIEASTLIDNTRSQNVLKNCGFKELGVSEKYLYINGQWRDHRLFYKLNEK